MAIESEAYRNQRRATHHNIADAADDDADRANEGRTLSDGIRFLWRGRNWFIFPALAGVLIGIAIIYLVGVLAPSTTTYRYAVSLTMAGAAPGEYSNGLAYAPTDLRAAGVLHRVHEQNDLDRYGIDQTMFSASVSVEAYSPIQLGLIERFRAQLGDRNLTTEERRVIEEQFRGALQQAKSDGVLVSFTVPDSIRLPADVATNVVTDIPAVWSELYTEVLGVTQPLIARSEAPLVDPELAQSLDYPLAFDYVTDALTTLGERLEAMIGQPGARNAKVPDTDQTIFDLQRDAERISKISIAKVLRPIVDSGVSREPLLTALSYENQIEQLRDQERLAAARTQVVTTVINDGRPPERNNQLNSDPNALPPPAVTMTSIPQFGDTFIDRIIDLSVAGEAIEFRQRLLSRKLELGESAAVLKTEREAAERRLAGIRAYEESAASMTELTEAFSTTLASVVDETNTIWKSANRLLDVMSEELLNEDKRLYSSLPIDGRVIRTSFLGSPYLWMVAIGLIVSLGALGMIAYVLRSVIIYRKRTA